MLPGRRFAVFVDQLLLVLSVDLLPFSMAVINDLKMS